MIFYHYGSVETFENIPTSKVLWLSNLTKSNDGEEVIRTFQILWERVKQRLTNSDLEQEMVTKVIKMLDQQYKIEVQTHLPCGCSFCHSGDLLQQWQEYGGKT